MMSQQLPPPAGSDVTALSSLDEPLQTLILAVLGDTFPEESGVKTADKP